MSYYLDQLRRCRSPVKAADLVRAWACHSVAGRHLYDRTSSGFETLLQALVVAEQHAQRLERPLVDDDGQPVVKPWRQWLRDWGYVR